MKKKKWFLFSHYQWLGFSLLILILIGVIISIKLINKYFINKIDNKTIIYGTNLANDFENYIEENKKSISVDTVEWKFHYFNPNIADSLELLQLSFKPWQAHSLLQYIRKGGKIRKKEKLLSIYNIDSVLYSRIFDFIYLPIDSINFEKDTLIVRIYPIKKDTIIELNSSDTATLKLISGIGSYGAASIVKYRKELGGFVSISQIKEKKELSYLPDSVFSHFIIDTTLVIPINVNRATVEQLNKHPYISFTQAKELYNYRRLKFNKVKSINELYNINSFDTITINKLIPYLTFEY